MNPALIAIFFVGLYLLTFVVGALCGGVLGYMAGTPKPEQVKKDLGAAYDAGYAAGHEDAEDDILDSAGEMLARAELEEPDDGSDGSA